MPNRRHFRRGALAVACLAVFAACGFRELPPPCDAATYSAIMARCSAAVANDCADVKGPCATLDRCRDELKQREATCLAR